MLSPLHRRTCIYAYVCVYVCKRTLRKRLIGESRVLINFSLLVINLVSRARVPLWLVIRIIKMRGLREEKRRSSSICYF